MKGKYKSNLVFGILMLFMGIAVEILLSGASSSISFILILVVLVLIIGSVLRHLKYGEGADRDERTKKLGAFALAYAWLVSLIFVGSLLWLDNYNVIKMTVSQVLSLTLAVMALAAGVFQWYFGRKGDLE